jgi:hypothetical protein
MNYAYQFSGADNNCIPPGDGVPNYSVGDRIQLNENNLNENNGTCGFDFSWDWNENSTIESSIVFNINLYPDEVAHCGSTLNNLRDFDDWSNIKFGGLSSADGAMLIRIPQEIITEQPVPTEYLNDID